MSEITTYSFDGQGYYRLDENGGWCKLSDHCAAISECNKGTREICAYFENKISDMEDVIKRIREERDGIREIVDNPVCTCSDLISTIAKRDAAIEEIKVWQRKCGHLEAELKELSGAGT